MLARIFIAFQYLLPKHLVTTLLYRVTRIRHIGIKNLLITKFINLYNVNIDEVKLSVPDDFDTFNDFFARELYDNARTIDNSENSIISPVDGTVSFAGKIKNGSIFQAKRINYSLDDLLATDLEQANAYINGTFATIYLAPYNYHRIHAPLKGNLIAARYVPGDLFSVNPATVERVKGLFHRNERLVMHLKTAHGPIVLIFVGALNVGSISTPWTGQIRPRKHGVVDVLDLSRHPSSLKKGDLLGWFNMGSTVIMLMSEGICEWNKNMQPGESLRMGEAIGQLFYTEK
ncbi:MAG: archaetidylserine decarboxylase [Woeseiaceae bacterium]|nr:archaetidylserine decarboxylase [Woeseiaceae bacterium]